MSYYSVYIGYMDNTFDWDKGDWSGNTPNRRSPFFPPATPFDKVIDKIDSGEFEGKQLDWGAWGAKVNKEQIVNFIKESYGDSSGHNWKRNQVAFPHLIEQMDELISFINTLDDTSIYVIIASEL